MRYRQFAWSGFGLLLLLAGAAYFFFPARLAPPLVALNRSLSQLSEHVVTLERHEIHYLDGGQGDTILLLHGIFAEKDHWVEFARSLTPHYRVIALDLPGFGASSRLPDQSYAYAEQVRRLHAFAERLQLRQIHLAGNSMGGTLAALYAISYPDQVRSVAFIGAPHGIRSPRPSEMERRVAAGEIPLIARNPAEFERMMDMLFVHRPFLPRPILQDAADKAIRLASSNVRLWTEQRRDAYLLQDSLPRLTVRTLALWGERDRIFDASGAPVLRQLLPTQQVDILPDLGHLPMMEQPGATAARYQAFLAQQP